MIEEIQIGPNPVTGYGPITVGLKPGKRKAEFSTVSVDRRANYGFFEAHFKLHDDPITMNDFFTLGLGHDVTMRNTQGDVVFEGMLAQMRRVGIGGAVLKTDIDSIANEVWVRYKDTGGTTTRSAIASDQASKDRFGTLQLVLSGGQLTSSGLAANIAAMVLERKRRQRAVPEEQRFGGRVDPASYIDVRVDGYIKMMNRRVYNQTGSTGVQAADLQIADIVAAVGQYVKSTVLQPNSVGVTKEYDADRWALDILMGIAACGDTLSPPNRWLLYMEAGRILKYEWSAPTKEVLVT